MLKPCYMDLLCVAVHEATQAFKLWQATMEHKEDQEHQKCRKPPSYRHIKVIVYTRNTNSAGTP